MIDALDDYGFEVYEENAFPIAYLLTFRTYGTWLHGDKRGSHQRGRGRTRTIKIASNVPLHEAMKTEIVQSSVYLDRKQRELVKSAILEVVEHRPYKVWALNVRSNHTHAVVSGARKPDRIVNDFKAYATRRLRELGQFTPEKKIWARGSSTRYLWKPAHVVSAIEYVLYSQGDVPFGTVVSVDGIE